MKEEKGVTMVALAITVAIMLVLVTISITAGTVNYKRQKDSQIVMELNMVQHAVMEQYYQYTVTNNEADLKGTKIEIAKAQEVAQKMKKTLLASEGYYSLSPEELTKIGIKRAEDTYIVNYKTGEVMNETKITTSEGAALYVSGK